jgi:HD-GYP domain-containing protein (c-di-GMP phosphodiesterase class II)
MDSSAKSLIPLSELMLALTIALDMTEGQPPEHCIRSCWIGMHIGEKIGLSENQLYDLFFTLLLKDAGCSSNAARICELYLTNDRDFKRNYKTVGNSLSGAINFVVKNAGVGHGWMARISTTIDILKNGGEYSQELIETRCSRGAQVARELRFSEDVAIGVHGLDEHWDGSGRPENLKAEQIPLYSRIALLAQVVDVFQFENDLATAVKEVISRRGNWFDPTLVDAFVSISKKPSFYEGLRASDICQRVMSLTPAKASLEVDDEYFDCIVSAFGKIVDSKSPYTAGHSERVAVYASLIAEELGMNAEDRRWLKRAALLHDLGKLGVSNTILDKPGKLTDEEWAVVKTHSALTEQILEQISPFKLLAKVAGAHHEKLDGTGYPNRLKGMQISLMTRIITAADIFDAITAERPYRGAIAIPKALLMMEENLHSAIDESCFDALKTAIAKLPDDFK